MQLLPSSLLMLRALVEAHKAAIRQHNRPPTAQALLPPPARLDLLALGEVWSTKSSPFFHFPSAQGDCTAGSSCSGSTGGSSSAGMAAAEQQQGKLCCSAGVHRHDRPRSACAGGPDVGIT